MPHPNNQIGMNSFYYTEVKIEQSNEQSLSLYLPIVQCVALVQCNVEVKLEVFDQVRLSPYLPIVQPPYLPSVQYNTHCPMCNLMQKLNWKFWRLTPIFAHCAMQCNITEVKLEVFDQVRPSPSMPIVQLPSSLMVGPFQPCWPPGDMCYVYHMNKKYHNVLSLHDNILLYVYCIL